MSNGIYISRDDLHPHIEARMQQRGVTFEEVRQAMAEGWDAAESKPGTFGKFMVFGYNTYWEGFYYQEKEVTVYYKQQEGNNVTLLTVIVRYGQNFYRGDQI
jgi:hypothetical protein